jgi:hypothetical protein
MRSWNGLPHFTIMIFSPLGESSLTEIDAVGLQLGLQFLNVYHFSFLRLR